MRLRTLILFVALLYSFNAKARTGAFGFSPGFGLGIAAIDLSDGTTRYNIGGIQTSIDMGFHIQDFAFGLEGQFVTLQTSFNDYVLDAGFFIKYYFLEDFFLKPRMGFTRFQRLSSSGMITTFTTYTGGSVGATLGWDIVSNGAFRFNLNVGAQRLDFGAVSTRQGEETSNMDLPQHMTGLLYFGYIGLNWYL